MDNVDQVDEMDEEGREDDDGRVSVVGSMRVFLLAERDRTIARLRQIERLLGMEQSIPERRR